MTITVVDFKIQFPEFDAVPAARIQLYIDESDLCFDEAQWGMFYNQGQMYFVAAMVQTFIVNVGSQTVLPVTSSSAGALSIGYSAGALPLDNTDLFYLSNKYGQKYIALRNKAVMGVLTVGSGDLDLPPLNVL